MNSQFLRAWWRSALAFVFAQWALACCTLAQFTLPDEDEDVLSDGKKLQLNLKRDFEKGLTVSLYRLAAEDKTLLWKRAIASYDGLEGLDILIDEQTTTVALRNRHSRELWPVCLIDSQGAEAFFSRMRILNRQPANEKLRRAMLGIESSRTPATDVPSRFQPFVAAMRDPAEMEFDPDSMLDQLWTAEGSLGFFDTVAARRVFCLWIGATNDWFAYRVPEAQPVAVDALLRARWNERGRRWALRVIRDTQPSPLREMLDTAKAKVAEFLELSDNASDSSPTREWRHVEDAYKFIARLKDPEDRKLIEALLASQDFSISFGGGFNGRVRTFGVGSRDRELGDQLLARWEGKLPEDVPLPDMFDSVGEYFFLGRVKGLVSFPFPPDAGRLWVHLVPAQFSPGEWQKRAPAMTLNGSLEPMSTLSSVSIDPTTGQPLPSRPSPELVEEAAFEFAAVRPGRYRLTALWDRTPPASQREEERALPEPGDYMSAESREFEVVAGQNVEELMLVCTNRIGALLALYADDAKRIQDYSAKSKPESPPTREAAESSSARQQSPPPPAKEWTPPEGTVPADAPIKLRRVTYGRRHKYFRHSHETETDALVIWFTPARGRDLITDFDLVLLDEHGCRFRCSPGGHMSGTGGEISYVELESFPRRQPTFKLLVEEADKAVAEVELPNLAGGEFPMWIASALPVTNDLGSGALAVLRGFSFSSDFPKLIFFREGESDPGWRVESVAYRDSTGNQADSLDGLCRGEQVLKLTARAVRTKEGRFAADERWTVSDLEIPPAGRFVRLDRTNSIQGVTLELLALTGTGEFTYSNGVPIAATATIDANATPMRRVWMSHPPREPEALVFIKGSDAVGLPGPELFLGRRGGVTRTVVSKVPHVAVRIRNWTDQHRLYIAGGEEIGARTHRFMLRLGIEAWGREGDVYFLPVPEDARQGKAPLMFLVQRCRELEFFVQNPAAAQEPPKLRELRAKAENGDAAAQYELAQKLRAADGVRYDEEAYERWLRSAAANGHVQARLEFAQHGYPPKPEAIAWLIDLADQGNAEAQAGLAWLYLGERGLPENFVDAVKWFTKAAEQGAPEGLRGLAVCYRDGKGLSRNRDEWLRLLRQAAEQGSGAARYDLGLACLAEPHKDFTEAFQWLKKAADAGVVPAWILLGGMCHRGEGTPKDVIEAYKWLTLAGPFHPEGHDSLEKLEREMTPEQLQEARRRIDQHAQKSPRRPAVPGEGL
ncbi:MAG: sel1 repeat family protein [Verrucomicrobia bacterium]|nr:sel1 repeat family protein [Verrucomicrobiota bacterium]